MNQGKSYLIAYLLWLPPCGFFGLHRFYLGKKVSANFYLTSLALFGIGWLWDSVNTYFLVRGYNEALQDNKLDTFLEGTVSDERALIPLPDELPHWIEPDDTPTLFSAYFELFLNLALIFLLFAVLYNYDLVIPLGFFIFIWFMIVFSRFTIWLDNTFIFTKYLPINIDNIVSINQLEHYFFENKPWHILLYLLFPVTFPFFIFTGKGKKEILQFQKLWIGAVVLFTFFTVFNFKKELSFNDFGALLQFEMLYTLLPIYLCSGIFLALVVLMLKNNYRLGCDTYRRVSLSYNFFTTIVLLALMLLTGYGFNIEEMLISKERDLKLVELRLSHTGGTYRNQLQTVANEYWENYVRHVVPCTAGAQPADSGKSAIDSKFMDLLNEGLQAHLAKHAKLNLNRQQASFFKFQLEKNIRSHSQVIPCRLSLNFHDSLFAVIAPPDSSVISKNMTTGKIDEK
ncbi:TM2 domain-containing protein [candidate division KSB1 bacterium]|nr:TM2 domain-containing protein [candidate division KSB1 bacterium]